MYHFAILVRTCLDLAKSLHHSIETNTPLQGFTDHLVSETIYLADPDDNGIAGHADIYSWMTRSGNTNRPDLVLDKVSQSASHLCYGWNDSRCVSMIMASKLNIFTNH
jgi:catechol 2,3-dioxygenase